jgi:hypothetical protein
MNAKQKRLLQIANDVFQWNLEMLAFFRRVGEVEAMPDISEADKQGLRDAAKQIGDLFKRVVELTDSQPTADDLIEQW